MRRVRFRSKTWILCFFFSSGLALGDGMVFPEHYYAKVEIPNQQALIHYSGGVERLVIETSFLAEGTNFAWVVPLPSAPQVQPVSEDFFANLQQAFQPTLIHRVNPYFAGILLVCGLAFLGARALRDETSWLADLPLCLLLSAGAALIGKHLAFGIVALGLALCIRLFARSPTIYAVILLIGTGFAAILTFVPNAHGPHLIDTMGSADTVLSAESIAGVRVVSVQHAGVFDITTLRGDSPKAVLLWLEQNGYQTPQSAEPALRRYIDLGWVFVSCKAHLPGSGSRLAALHALAFTFPSRTQVYPTRLTATGDRDCSIALYVLGNRRATARHFSAVRSDRLALGSQIRKGSPEGWLRISDPEVLGLIGNSTVGTKLFAKMTSAQMASDVEIGSSFRWSKGRRVYSHSGALMIALNVALPVAALCWMLAGTSQGGWGVTKRWISNWRRGSLAAATILGVTIFLLLPKVEVETVRQPFPQGEGFSAAFAISGFYAFG